MTLPTNIIEQETAPQLTPLAILYVPVIMALMGLARLAVRAGIIRLETPASTEERMLGLFTNRYFRRAQAACFRQELRLMARTGKPLAGITYFPRRLRFLPYTELTSCEGSIGRFMARYARDSGTARTQVFGLSAAHYIAGVIETLLGQAATIFADVTAPLSLAAPSDPAPP